jgi:4-diphosphocytidyl-2-C-methyl-D-erythritol kinase
VNERRHRAGRAVRRVHARAFAKINLTLRVLGVAPDGYHELRTTFQTLALHDTLTFAAVPGPFRIQCDEPRCPVDETNLVWRAANLMWRACGRRRPMEGVTVTLVKRIPLEGGLGGGSSDAAATLRALSVLWDVPLELRSLEAMARELGADVPFFLAGGTALGLGRGDRILPLADLPSLPVVLVSPPFGVSTRDAYSWWDAAASSQRDYAGTGFSRAGRANGSTIPGLDLPAAEIRNDLQRPVSRHHRGLARIVGSLNRLGARHAAMSGSGSAVFGLFDARREAQAAARAFARAASTRAVVTRTLSRARYARLSRPALAALRPVV